VNHELTSLRDDLSLPASPPGSSEGADHADGIAALLDADNLRRVRWMGLAIPIVDLFCLLLLQMAASADPPTQRWQEWLRVAHLAMGASFALLAVGAHALLRSAPAPSFLGRVWPLLAASVALGYGLAFVAIDQLVGANITTFLLATTLTGVIVVMHPLASALLYGAALGGFWTVIGIMHHDPIPLMASRLNGITACALGWVLAAITWRQHVKNKRLTQALERAATRDSLTGLANRMETVRLVDEELRRALRHGHATSLLLLDLDHFKQVNDRLGHPGGDLVLQRAAAVLRNSVRAHDRVGRMGGEEFLVLLPQTDANAARALAERLRLRLAEALGTHGKVTCSIGLVTAGPAQAGSGFDPLYLQADQALYRAKAGGRNRCEVAA